MRTYEERTIDVMIPVYQPGEKFRQLVARLGKQTKPVNKIIVMNTGREYWREEEYAQIPNLEVHHVTPEEYDHGGTRHQGAGYSEADILVFITDDAVPADQFLIERLAGAFDKKGPEGERVIMAYACQLAAKDCQFLERYTRSFNYPDTSRIKTLADLPELGIKTYFASNACCAYDRELYYAQGGFIKKTIFNEDMIFAGLAIQAGYAIAYEAKARVIHSHNYSCMQQFHRNFDLAVSQADHPEVFDGIKSESEGIRLMKSTARYLVQEKKAYMIPQMIMKNGFKYLGYLLGKRYRKLPGKLVLWCSMNRNYWK